MAERVRTPGSLSGSWLVASGERLEGGSFRDPAGVVFERDGVVLRQVNRCYEPLYRQLMDSGLYPSLVADGLLVSHEEVDEPPLDAGPSFVVLRPQPIQFISYPYEWCFGQLKDAALLTLAIQRAAVGKGMSLKDASAFNVQWHHGRPIFIDTLSFEARKADQPWVAYRQFCQHFLAPLALMSRVDVRLGQLTRLHLDGIPLDLAAGLLPFSTRIRPGLLVHLHAHASAQRSSVRRQAVDSKVTGSRGSFPDAALHGLLDHLESTIRSLHWEPGGTTWDDYYDHTNYSTAGMETKRRLVAEWLHLAETREVWDLGANDGTFSRLAATGGAHVVSFDVDPSCVERNYRSIRESGGLSVLPLWLDVDNPTPSVGWQHSERRSWLERGPVDTVLALALVHHLAIGNNVPLPRIAELLSRCARRWLIIEFVPKGDSQCARLLASREDVFRDYDENRLLEALGRYFRPERSASIPESQRSLHLLRKVA